MTKEHLIDNTFHPKKRIFREAWDELNKDDVAEKIISQTDAYETVGVSKEMKQQKMVDDENELETFIFKTEELVNNIGKS